MGDPIGGIRRHVHAILQNLNSGQFAFSYAYSRRNSDRAFLGELDELCHRHQVVGLSLDMRKRPHPSDVHNLRQLWAHAKQWKCDIVHGHGAKGGVYARTLARLAGLPCVYTPHGGSLHPGYGALERATYAAVERWLASWTALVMFESKYSARRYDALVGLDRVRWQVNYNGIAPLSLPLASSGASVGLPRIGIFAMLRREKGQAVALDAARKVAVSGLQFEMHLFGDGPDRARLEGLARQGAIDGRVFFHGDVPNPLDWMVQMDLILVPSIHESFGYSALEAVVAGVPVIASRVGGLIEIAELLPAAVHTVAAGDSEALAAAACRLLNVSRVARLERAPVRLPPEFCLSSMIANLEAAYLQLHRAQPETARTRAAAAGSGG